MEINGLKKDSESPKSFPLWLLAELSYKCPLQCPYCSNPLDIDRHLHELDAEQWCDVLTQARSLGAVQLGLSGGEPLLKTGLVKIVQHAKGLGFYSNLITSGLGLNAKKIDELKEAGLDHIQLSVQAPDAALNDRIAGRESFRQKMAAARMIKDAGFPMVMNIVLHRENIGKIREIIELALELKADYLELANVQFDGWAYLNRGTLLPSQEQVHAALQVTEEYQEKYQQRMKIFYVIPDYFADRPKPCCNGWGNVSMVITPSGSVLPCLGAQKLGVADIPNVKSQALSWIWEESPLFNAFRGFEWMREPCRSCPEKFKDFGGCRCQAYLLTKDAANTDPVCSLSPLRSKVDAVLASTDVASFDQAIYRSFANSKKLRSGDTDTMGARIVE
ncbi:MAG: pyrroloquinoline quinone biosynthesis protein PqqE [Oligoflexus sp.]